MTVLESLAKKVDLPSTKHIGHLGSHTQTAPLLPGSQLSNWHDKLTMPSHYGPLPENMKLLANLGQWFGNADKNHRMSWVYSDDPDNPHGGFTFVYQLDVAQTPIDRMSFIASAGIYASVAVVDFFYVGVNNGGFVAPSSIDRSSDGKTIGVNWDGGIPLGESGWSSTPAVVLYTDMKEFHVSRATFSYLGGEIQTANALTGILKPPTLRQRRRKVRHQQNPDN